MKFNIKNIVFLFLTLSPFSQNLRAGQVITSVQDFNAIIQKTSGNIVVKFFAHWCNPCKVLTKTLVNDIMPKYQETITFVEVDIDLFRTLAEEYGIRKIPTMLFFKNGEKIHTIQNSKISPEALRAEINLYFNLK